MYDSSPVSPTAEKAIEKSTGEDNCANENDFKDVSNQEEMMKTNDSHNRDSQGVSCKKKSIDSTTGQDGLHHCDSKTIILEKELVETNGAEDSIDGSDSRDISHGDDDEEELETTMMTDAEEDEDVERVMRSGDAKC